MRMNPDFLYGWIFGFGVGASVILILEVLGGERSTR